MPVLSPCQIYRSTPPPLSGIYMISNADEYWAEGCQSWFDATIRTDVNDGHNTREKLRAHDPRLSALLCEVSSCAGRSGDPASPSCLACALLLYDVGSMAWPTSKPSLPPPLPLQAFGDGTWRYPHDCSAPPLCARRHLVTGRGGTPTTALSRCATAPGPTPALPPPPEEGEARPLTVWGWWVRERIRSPGPPPSRNGCNSRNTS